MTPGYSLQEKHGYWHAVISYKDDTGRYRQKSISTRIPAIKGNKRKAEVKGKELTEKWLQKEAENQRDVNTIMLSDAITDYISSKGDALQPNTAAEYRRLGYNIITTLGDLPVSGINDEIIKTLKEKLKGKGDSDNTIRHYIILINSALQLAEQKGYSLSEFGYHAEAPKPPKHHGDWYTVDEVRQLLAAADDSDIRCAVYLSAYLGLRRSEVLGLRWDNVNIKDKFIRICEKRVEYSDMGKTIVKQSNKMKTEYSDRILPIPEAVCEVLEVEQDKSGHIVKDAKSNPLAPQYLTRKFAALLEKHGLRKIRFHDLRHTCASLLLQSGVDMKTVQIILGHGNYSTTADIYSHVDLSGKKEALSKYESIL